MSQTEEAQLVSPPTYPAPQTEDHHYRRLGWLVLALLIGIIGIWGSLAPLSSAIPASGKVSVASSNRIIQHQDGGIVKAIMVKDGDRVKKSQLLLELDATQAQAQQQIIQSQYYENLGLESRLIAERDGRDAIAFNPEMDQMSNMNGKNLITEAQRREFQVRAQQLVDERQVLSERISQLQNQITGLKATVEAKSSLSSSYADEIKEWEVLYEQQLIDKMRLRDIKREKVRTDGDIANARSEIARIGAQIGEIKAQILAQKQGFLKEVVAELSDTQAKLADNRARLSALNDTLARTKIMAPIGGIIANLSIHTVGGVITPGKSILEIVPENEPLIIEGRVTAIEIANVHAGLKAEIRFPGFSHIKSLGVVLGEVVEVAPDAVMDETTKALYYPLEIQVTPEGQQELLHNHLSIQPGMPADMMVVTASRTFLDYMIQPFKNVARKAFNEQ
jgi:epimerase transport system membrane fusion protein